MSEKTEQPTPKKLRDARKKGQVPKSREVVSTALFISVVAVLYLMWDGFYADLEAVFSLPAQLYDQPFSDAAATMSAAVITLSWRLLAVVVGAVVLTAIATSLMQTGIVLSGEPVKPELKKVNPFEGLKRLFNMQNLFEFAKSIVKVFFLGILLFFIIRDSIRPSVHIPACGMPCVTDLVSQEIFLVVLYSTVAFVLVAAVDFLFQRWHHTKNLKMSKDEVKREYKEMEGDPQIKGQRKQFHMEIMNENMLDRVRKSTVLVTNPHRLAVALYYDHDETPLPMVLAKGENILAERMIAVAREAGVPIMENVPLARALLSDAELEQYIPADLIEPVAEVLRWVQQLDRSV